MDKLKCEILGGSLVAGGDGFFECEYCGMKYNIQAVNRLCRLNK